MTKEELQAKVDELETLADNKVAKFYFFIGCGISFILGFLAKAMIF